ncbi:hypothetical protein [Halosimplex sp. TS25]|uniref:hypothetical protein n=1 Tax=Halosimplex rarum TaxID=3396619 RepID=UPI0039EB0D46
MIDSGGRSVVLQDFLIAAMAAISGGLSGVDTEITVDQWWIAALAAAVTATLLGASDRSRTGVWVLAGVGVLAMAGIVWSAASDSLSTAALSLGMIGMGAGMALNRLVFGVVGRVPDARLDRERDRGRSWL